MYSKQFNRKLKKILYKFSSILLLIHKDRLFRKSNTRQYKLNIFLIQTTIIYTSTSTTTYVYVRHVFVLYLWESIFKLVHSALQKWTSQNCNFDFTKFLSHKKFVFEWIFLHSNFTNFFLNNCIFVCTLCEAYYTLNHLSPLSSWMSAKERPRTSTCYT